MKSRNVLFIMCDQLRWDALGCYGNQLVRTPNIDALCQNGVRFTNMFAANPVCAPNRGAIATGRWPKVNGLVGNGYVLPHDETTMMDVFREHGYGTYGVGKMHFTPQWDFGMDEDGRGARNPQPEDSELPHYGFEHCRITEDHREGPYAEYLKAQGYDHWDELHSFSRGKQHAAQASIFPEEHYQTTWISDRAVDYLEQHDDEQPFFMWLSYVDPHHPFTPPKPYDTMYAPEDMPLPVYREGEHELRHPGFNQRYHGDTSGHEQIDLSQFSDRDWQRITAHYYGMISLIDKNVGRVVEALKQQNALDDTIIVFTTDHGEMLGDHHLLFKPYPFDCVTRVPFFVTAPGLPAGQDVDILCRSLEIMPTILELADLPAPEHIHGRSLRRHLEGSRADEIFENILIDRVEVQTVRTKRYRLSVYYAENVGELYDLERDPDNLENLWNVAEYQQVKEELFSQVLQRLNEAAEPRFQRTALC